MNIEHFFATSGSAVTFSRSQASLFAKSVAGDFNPIHDIDTRRFCVPGDLLFAVVLHLRGVSQSMEFEFLNMVDDGDLLETVPRPEGLALTGSADKKYLDVSISGECSADPEFAKALTSAYVQFSGKTFPYLLVDLMRAHEVMINPARPLVIYKSMSIQLEQLNVGNVKLEHSESSLVKEGKKAEVILYFDIYRGEEKIGKGNKKMLLGGLRQYDQAVIDVLVEDYQETKNRYLDAPGASAVK